MLRATLPCRSAGFGIGTTVLGLALADVSAFAVSAELFRVGHAVPRLLFYRSFPEINAPIDVFYILGALFIAVRYVSGDYSRRQLFWDGARLSTIGLLVASMPCLLLLFFVNGQYSVWAELCSWIFVIIGIPMFRQGVRHLMSLASLWRVPTALIGDGQNALEAMDAFRSSLSLGFDVRFLIALKELPGEFEEIRPE